MPPIPPTYDAETSSIIGTLRRSSIDISEVQIPRLRDCKGPVAIQQRYATQLRESLDEFDSNVENLEGIAEDMAVKRERDHLKAVADGFRTAYTTMRKDMRLALLHSKKTIDLETKNTRDELFKGSLLSDDKRSVDEKATDDALMQASNNVTDALRRTIDAMQRELERSVHSQQMLDHSTATLSATSTRHDTLSSLITTSSHLITALEKADWLDRLIIFAALAFFLLVVLFILKQRIVDRGIRLAFWWVRWVPGFGSGSGRVYEDLEKGVLLTTSEVTKVVTSVVMAVSASTSPSSTLSLTLPTSQVTSPTSSISLSSQEIPTTSSIIESIIESIIPVSFAEASDDDSSSQSQSSSEVDYPEPSNDLRSESIVVDTVTRSDASHVAHEEL